MGGMATISKQALQMLMLVSGRVRGSQPVVMGDFNVDQLPVSYYDPWSDSPGRILHHRFERAHL